jgi:transposase
LPAIQHGSGLGDHRHGGELSLKSAVFDPVGETRKPLQTGPNPSQNDGEGTGMAHNVGNELTRKQRKELARRLRAQDPGLEVVHPNAAGIDVGNSAHYVAVAPGRDPEPVRRFGCFTMELHRMAEWLKSCRIQTVVMQSTGVYWIPLYEVLEQRGFRIFLVNARQTRSLPGRKSDVQESQWLLKLHTYGLLNNSFQPSDEVRVLRTYWRQRADQVRAASICIQRMQKVMTEMNLQLANVISDLSGVSGMAIVRAILAGERDGDKLAKLANRMIRASAQDIARSLQGNWREELLFLLRQEVELYDLYQQRILECDRRVATQLNGFASKQDQPAGTAMAPARPKRIHKPKGNAPRFDLGTELHRITGVDLTRIDGIDVLTAQTLISEIGMDMGRWKTEAHFASWLGLSPDNRISGDKVLRRGTRPVVNRAATALRMAACTLLRSKTYLGGQYRRLRTRLGAPKAITAMAHKLARLIYRLLKYGQDYADKGLDYYENRFREQQITLLRKKALALGFQITETPVLP